MRNERRHVIKPDELLLRDYLAEERTVLANERTFLAYIRTALAVAVGGVSLIHFIASTIADVFGIILIFAAIATFIIGIWRYIRTRRSLDKQCQSIRIKQSK